jgi:hypothetical protein
MAATSNGEPPMSAPIRFRDSPAHQRLGELNADLLWETSVREAPVLSKPSNYSIRTISSACSSSQTGP